jgi:hypothetical protein
LHGQFRNRLTVIHISIPILEERISDLLCNALEGGSNYWYWIKSYNYPDKQTKESLKLGFPHIDLPFAEGGSLTIQDREGDMPDKILDRKAMMKGLSIMAKDYPHHFGDFMTENDDATTGDVFLQCALYGEVIYG